jgi:TetR/AcrR family transcriptional regulator, mexJK operon transcriptional repressor
MPLSSSQDSPSSEPAAAQPRAGRPSRHGSEQLRERILETATELLFSQGYGATSIEAIARHARVSKRTFYHRFEDKPALMNAVVARLIDGLRPPANVALIEGQSLEEILVHLAVLILQAAMKPQALQLHRLIVAEAQRFPDLAAAVARSGGRQEAVTLISELLRKHAGERTLAVRDAIFAAQQFLQMVVSLPRLRALGLGHPMTSAELDAWARGTVALFLGGFASLASQTTPPS